MSAGHRWLVLRLRAPLMAFGGIAVDQLRPTRNFPAASMLTGLVGNALGWDWCDSERHQSLQGRLVFAARQTDAGQLLTDMQNVAIQKADKGWTTRNAPEGRDGGGKTYASPHRRTRDYHADGDVDVVLRLQPSDAKPTLDGLRAAFVRPARSLFIGRKACLPAASFVEPEPGCWVEAGDAYAALCALSIESGGVSRARALWPVGEGPANGACVDRLVERADLRNWRTGLHSGSRQVVEGWTV